MFALKKKLQTWVTVSWQYKKCTVGFEAFAVTLVIANWSNWDLFLKRQNNFLVFKGKFGENF